MFNSCFAVPGMLMETIDIDSHRVMAPYMALLIVQFLVKKTAFEVGLAK